MSRARPGCMVGPWRVSDLVPMGGRRKGLSMGIV